MSVPHKSRMTTSLGVMITIDMEVHGSPWGCVRNPWQRIQVNCRGGTMANAIEAAMGFHSTALVCHLTCGVSSKLMVWKTQTVCVLAFCLDVHRAPKSSLAEHRRVITTDGGTVLAPHPPPPRSTLLTISVIAYHQSTSRRVFISYTWYVQTHLRGD